MAERIACRSTDGLDLEAAIAAPDHPRGAFVLCHPHPQMGGTMNAPLLLAVEERLVADGWALLRFNFRGIGDSEGKSSAGIEEIADAEGAVETARRRWPSLPLAIGGWSFGASIAIRVAAEERELVACAAVAPAVVPKPGVTAGLPPPLPPPDGIRPSFPLLVVCGSNDRQVGTTRVRSWAEAVGSRYVEVPGANHFFWGMYDRLGGILSDWLNEVADR